MFKIAFVTLLTLFGFADEIPLIGFGTYPFTGNECATALEKAAESGYRIIDTATFYENFEPIGEVLKKKGRESFYLISKVWHDKQAPADLLEDLNLTLEQLQTDYLDAYLIHWPNSEIPIEETLQAMAKLKEEGKIRDIGLSNVTVNHLKRVLELAIPITWVQIEMSPFFYDPELLAFCQENGISIQAWSPLGRGGCSQDPLLTKIGKKYGKTPCQVALRWVIQHGCLPLPASHNENHIRENGKVFDFSLSEKEMAQIDKKAKEGTRMRTSFDEFDFSYEQCWPKS